MPETSSMTYWYPIVSGLAIPQPKTEWIPVDLEKFYSIMDQVMGPDEYGEIVSKVRDAIFKVGGCPAFMRTDQMSAKHSWKDTCFLSSEDQIGRNLYRLIEEHFMGMMREMPCGIYIREYIPLFSAFDAFLGEMPVSKERRYFVRDGEVVCHHPYWPQDAIRKPSVEGWEASLAALNEEDEHEVALLTEHSALVGKNIDGYWSVDYAMGEDEVWYLIDMALGDESWHPDCPHKPRPKTSSSDYKDPFVG